MSQTDTASPPSDLAKLVRVRQASIGAVFMLVIQFILGIIFNLYGTIPPSGHSFGLFSNGWLILHEIMGVLLVGAAIGLVARSFGTGSGFAKATSAIGLLAIIAAFGAGVGFTRSTGNGASLGMALAFAIALICYVLNLARLPSAD
ncbi:MAG TPA: hypothetical protein VKU39_16110 [Streptosporangiaceae bacterium]|nr:hypothetical protein [Streptosporangiaceae bacterium]